MAYKARKTEHTGSKKGRGAYAGRKRYAKHESAKVRRRADLMVVIDSVQFMQNEGVHPTAYRWTMGPAEAPGEKGARNGSWKPSDNLAPGTRDSILKQAGMEG